MGSLTLRATVLRASPTALARSRPSTPNCTPIYREFDFPIDQRCAVFNMYVRELVQWKMLAVRRSNKQILNRVFVSSERLLHSHHKVELLLSLNDLSRRRASQRGLNQSVYVTDVQSIARDLGAIRFDDQARLSQFANDHDMS